MAKKNRTGVPSGPGIQSGGWRVKGQSGHRSEGMMGTGSGEPEAQLSRSDQHLCQSGDRVMDSWRIQQQGVTEGLHGKAGP